MANEKYESQDVLGSNEPSPYTAQSLEEDVDADGPEPLTRALESRHMQMIAIVSPSFPPLSPRTVKRNKLSNAQNLLLGRCYRCWSICWFRRSPRQWRPGGHFYLLYNGRVLDVVYHDVPR